MFFILVDAHSKWPEVVEMKSTTSVKTIEVLRTLFASYGIPDQVVSDNGPQFTADEFVHFMKVNRIKHIRSAPYHPSTNGLAEQFVQTFKRAMQASEQSGRSFNQRLSNFLLSYRTTPHGTTNRTPSSLFLSRELRTRLDLLRPDKSRKVEEKQAAQKLDHDTHAKGREYKVGDPVMARNYGHGPKWESGVVVERKGPVSYTVQLESGILWRRHIDQLRDGVTVPSDEEVDYPSDRGENDRPEQSVDGPDLDDGPELTESGESTPGQSDSTGTDDQSGRRYPTRDRRPPPRYM